MIDLNEVLDIVIMLTYVWYDIRRVSVIHKK